MKNRSAIVLALLVGASAVFDFYRGYQHERSIVQGAIFVILGFGVLGLFWWVYSRRTPN